MAANKIIKYGIEFETDKNSLNDLKKEIDSFVKILSQIGKDYGLSNELKQTTQDAKKLQEILSKSWDTKLSSLNLSKLNTELKKCIW